MGFGQRPFDGSALSLPKASAKQRPCAAPEAGLPSPSSLRDATSPKVRGLGSPPSFQFHTLRPAAARGAEGAALRLSAFAKGSPFGGAGAKRLRGRGCWQEAAHLVWHCLAEAQPHRKHDLNLGSAPPEAALPSPSSLTRCHLSQSERPWQSAKFPVLHFTPCCRKKSRQALREDFPPLPRAPPLGELAKPSGFD